MKIQWLAHAAFMLEGQGIRVLTDPFEPCEEMNLPPITEKVDVVVRSSDDDQAHCHLGTLPEGYELVTATDIVDVGATAAGIDFKAIGTRESLEHKENPRDNAMYSFSLEGIRVAHMGDVGNALRADELEGLKGVDVLLALAGGPPTIELDDLMSAIQYIEPRVVIPMHYRIPGPKFFMLPVTELTARFAPEQVTVRASSSVEFTKETLPELTTLCVLQPTLFRLDDEDDSQAA